jgi:hypothetical protein
VTKAEDKETPQEARERVAKEAADKREAAKKDQELRESGATHHVRAKVEMYVNECFHNPGDVLDVSELDYNEDIMEEVEADIPVTRASTPRAPSKPIPASGGREEGVPTEDFEPSFDSAAGSKKRR